MESGNEHRSKFRYMSQSQSQNIHCPVFQLEFKSRSQSQTQNIQSLLYQPQTSKYGMSKEGHCKLINYFVINFDLIMKYNHIWGSATVLLSMLVSF